MTYKHVLAQQVEEARDMITMLDRRLEDMLAFRNIVRARLNELHRISIDTHDADLARKCTAKWDSLYACLLENNDQITRTSRERVQWIDIRDLRPVTRFADE